MILSFALLLWREALISIEESKTHIGHRACSLDAAGQKDLIAGDTVLLLPGADDLVVTSHMARSHNGLERLASEAASSG